MIELYIDTGKNRRFLIGSDGNGIASESGMIQYKFHDKNENDHQDNADRKFKRPSARPECQLEDTVEPPSRLLQRRPGSRGASGSDASCDHTGT